MESINAALLIVLGAPLVAVITWLSTKRKTVVEVESISVSASAASVATMKAVLEEVKKELLETQKENDELREEIKQLRRDLTSLRLTLMREQKQRQQSEGEPQ